MVVAEIRSIFSWEDFQRMKASLVELKIKMAELNLVLAKQLNQNHPEYAKTMGGTIALVLVLNHNIDKIYVEVDATVNKVLLEISPQGEV